jgi:crotonobetainyl-CoA:carnitine CoA-transferase CaiB-like acyl-CoA transferase
MNRFFDSALNRSQGLVWALENPLYGVIEQPGAFWNFVDVPMKPRYAAPDIGEHSDEILSFIGVNPDQIKELRTLHIVQ